MQCDTWWPIYALNYLFLYPIGRPQEDEVFGLPGGNYPKEMTHQSRNLFQYGSGIKHSKKFSSLKEDINKNSTSSAKPTVVTDLGKKYEFTYLFKTYMKLCI